MKVGNTKFMLLALMLSVASIVRGIDSLTVGMAFNFSVGDTFEYRSYEYCQCGPFGSTSYHYFPMSGYTVTGRIDLADTIVYEMQCLYSGQLFQFTFSSPDSNVLAYKENDQTIPMGCLNFNADMTCDTNAMYCQVNSSALAGRLTIQRENMYFESYRDYVVGEGLGLVSTKYSALEYISGGGSSMGISGGYVTKLVRYVSGGIERYKDNDLYYTGVSEPSDASTIGVYPNPVRGLVKITGLNIQSGIARIFDVNGRMLSVYPVNSNESSLDVSALNHGAYFIQVINNNGSLVHYLRFIKE